MLSFCEDDERKDFSPKFIGLFQDMALYSTKPEWQLFSDSFKIQITKLFLALIAMFLSQYNFNCVFK